MSRRAQGVYVRAAFRRAEATKRAFDPIAAQLLRKTAQRRGQTRAPPLQRGEELHAQTHHAHTSSRRA
eukprot:9215249-Lingulodinium_polyedra.AAC.1